MPRVSSKKDPTVAVVKKISKRAVKKPKVTVRKNDEADTFDVPKKKILLSDLKPTTRNKNNAKKKNSDSETIIVLPEKVENKLLEKVNFYRDLVSGQAPKIMRIVANIGGYTFIIGGIYLCFLVADIKEGNTNSLLALTSCGSDDCISLIDPNITTSSTVQNLNDLNLQKPQVFFSSDFPKEPENDFTIKIETKDVYEVKVLITSDSTSGSIELTPIDNNLFAVPASTLKPGIYTFRAKALALDKITRYYFSGEQFTVKKPEIISTTVSSIIHQTDSTATSTNEVHLLSNDTETEEAMSEVIDPKIVHPFVEVHKFDGENNFRFLIRNIADSRFVEVYAAPELSNNPRFLGLAIQRDNVWVYHFNGNNLPVGNYEVFVKASIAGNILKSEPALFKVTKSITTQPPKVISDTDEVVFSEKIKRTFEEQSKSTTTNNISLLEKRITYFEKFDKERESINNINEQITTELVETPIKREAVELLNQDKDKLNRLLKRYASTLQGEDKNLNRRAKEEITKFRDSLVTESTFNTKTKDISAQIAVELDKEIERLQKKVERYETLIRERSELIGKDSDNDGITDFDEVNLYKTDINSPDTDGDGVLDGVEIVGGYNPNDADLEAVITFHSPKDVNYIDEENMKIVSVTPVIETDAKQGGVPILAEIKGKGLPNSFVTLFIYSSPTVVSVKTDENGDFVYTFTKELEDGNHEVYIAITDNKGEIVARSNPFQFVKTAEAFTPVDAKNSESINYNEHYKNTELSSYNIVAAMGIVSFGLILLMLGHTLRGRSEKISEGENKQNDTGT